MATTTTPGTGESRLMLDDILVGDNVRDIDQEHVDNLAQSIALRGLLVPLIVRPTSAGYELDVEHRATLRELTRQAHGTNLDLGTQLLTELAAVGPDDIDVARFFALGLLGPESGNYLGTGDHIARTIAANGLRLVLDEHRTTTTPTLKSGKPGKTKVAYGDVDIAAKWLWRFVDGAKTAGELYGRVLVVFAAQHYATQLVLPNSQRRGSALPRSHKDIARKSFERVTKRVLPASHKELQRALAAEARGYRAGIEELDTRRREMSAAGAGADDGEVDPDVVEPADDAG